MFGPLSPEENGRIAGLPRITRARGGRLYGADGSRWIDCWADGGRALIGHRSGGVSLRLKNELDRGLYSPYPTVWTGRLEKALLRLFPGYRRVGLFENLDCAMTACGIESLPADPMELARSLTRVSGALWGRPLLPDHPAADLLFPILPVPGLTAIQPVLFAGEESPLPSSTLFSPMVLAALTRSCSALGDGKAPNRGESADIWERRGPYMMFRGSAEDYDEVFESLFVRNVLIAPSPRRPSVYPRDLSPGEQRLLNSGESDVHE